jgi:hypothetical protein
VHRFIAFGRHYLYGNFYTYMRKHFKFLILLVVLSLHSASAPSMFATSTDNPLTCTAPTNLQFAYVGGVTQFSWDAVPNALHYRVQFKYPGFTWANLEYEEVVYGNFYAPPFEIQSYTIDWRVIAVCSSGEVESADAQFTVPCPVPVASQVTNITSNSALLQWTAGAGYSSAISGFVLAYRVLGNTNWISAGSTGNTSFQLNNLAQNTTYEWCVNQTCAYFNSTPLIGQFTTLPAPVNCTDPTGLNAVNITTNSAMVLWSASPFSTQFIVEYRAGTSGVWTLIPGITTTGRVLSGLASNQLYQYRVKSVCGSTTSGYSAIGTFTTTCLSLVSSLEWIDYFSIGTIQRTSGSEPNGYINTGISTNLVIGSVNAAQFSAGFNSGNTNRSYAIFLDLNRNGNFETSEKIWGDGMTSNGSIRNLNVTIPASATPGVCAMRVIMIRQSTSGAAITPCYAGSPRGEAEDYTVNLIASSAAFGANTPPDALERDFDTPQPSVGVSPNPNTGQFTISSETPIIHYMVYDRQGRVLINTKVPNETIIDVDLGVVPDGIYFVIVTDANGHISQHKVLVQH